ncbi:MAG: hypothetical protein Q8N94_08595 [Methanoregula sp.]|nr:hypothetical protein [Methanoregula sp.]
MMSPPEVLSCAFFTILFHDRFSPDRAATQPMGIAASHNRHAGREKNYFVL